MVRERRSPDVVLRGFKRGRAATGKKRGPTLYQKAAAPRKRPGPPVPAGVFRYLIVFKYVALALAVDQGRRCRAALIIAARRPQGALRAPQPTGGGRRLCGRGLRRAE